MSSSKPLSLREACLLDVSGELSPAARQALLEYIAENPMAGAQYEALRREFAVLGMLPIPEPSAAERRAIPARIKHAVQRELLRLRAKQAARRWTLVRWAAGSVGAAAACAVICVAAWGNAGRGDAEVRGRVAKINAIIDRASASAYGPAASEPGLDPMDPAGREVRRLAHVFEGWATVPQDVDDLVGGGSGVSNDPSAPPGT